MPITVYNNSITAIWQTFVALKLLMTPIAKHDISSNACMLPAATLESLSAEQHSVWRPYVGPKDYKRN